MSMSLLYMVHVPFLGPFFFFLLFITFVLFCCVCFEVRIILYYNILLSLICPIFLMQNKNMVI